MDKPRTLDAEGAPVDWNALAEPITSTKGGETTISTDHKWKQFRYRYEVPARVLADQFDHLAEEESSDTFILYRKHWYHLSDFMQGGPEEWDGVAADSYFSGILIRVSEDGEQYQVATYMS